MKSLDISPSNHEIIKLLTKVNQQPCTVYWGLQCTANNREYRDF